MANTVWRPSSGALIFSITLVPVLATFAYRKPQQAPRLAGAAAGPRAYEPTLAASLRRPYVVLLLAGAALAAALMALPRLGSSSCPSSTRARSTSPAPSLEHLADRRGASWSRASPRSCAATQRWTRCCRSWGRPEDGTDATLTNNLEFFAKLKPPEKWPPGGSLAEAT
jgi:cobalt-zinc-cadmium resistance protein CzcA